MRRFVFWLSVLVTTSTLVAQDGTRARLDAALDAWDTGQYPDALDRLRKLLGDPGSEAVVEPIALLTGELYTSTEISPPDRLVVSLLGSTAPKWSPGGQYYAFESRAGDRRTIHMSRLMDGAFLRAEPLDGFAAAFSFDGARIAFLRIIEDDELRAARSVARSAPEDDTRRNTSPVASLEAARTAVIERNLTTGSETIVVPPGSISPLSVHYSSEHQLFVTAAPLGGSASQVQVYRVAATAAPRAITSGDSPTCVIQSLAAGRLLVGIGSNDIRTVDVAAGASVPICPIQPLDRNRVRVTIASGFGIVDPAAGTMRTVEATSFSGTPGGSTVVFGRRANGQSEIGLVSVLGTEAPNMIKTSPLPLTNPAIAPDGRHVAFQMMPRQDWELYLIDVNTKSERRITNEIQHDHTARFLTNDRLFGVIGENRHRRSYVYDLTTGRRTRLFHNNTLRTLSMEYGWAISPDGNRILIVADRDGDTISPERGVYMMNLMSRVTREELQARVERQLAGERELRERGRQMFSVLNTPVRDAVRDVSARRIYEYERDLVAFGSKYVTQPGNRLAAEYIHGMLTSFGYTPEYQYFDAVFSRTAPAVRSANVIATLRGTVHPELEYLVSSHFDSVEEGPGADDDTSGTAALLEVARILRSKPMPATIKFIWFTGEEAGLLGSEEYVRQAVARRDKVVGALNNDMIGFADDNRLDDTIRFSNASLRDLQHAAAFLFTNLVTYDTRYFRGTDADSYFGEWGDIFSGIGSYPILGNPHYHESHDTLDTVSIPLITEVAKATTASIMLMASSPSRLERITAVAKGSGAEISWTPAQEKDISGYLVRTWTDARSRDARTNGTRITINGVRAGDAVWVKAVNARGLEGWDWQRATVK